MKRFMFLFGLIALLGLALVNSHPEVDNIEAAAREIEPWIINVRRKLHRYERPVEEPLEMAPTSRRRVYL